MTDQVERHYEELLAAHYTWLFGMPFEAKVLEQKDLLARLLGPGGQEGGLAIDLGSGPGFQALALADLGFAPVLALDTSAQLLDELVQHRAGRPVIPILANLSDLARHAQPGTAALVTCMGDTLTHLPDRDAVRRLFRDIHAVLRPGGRLVLTWRDLTAPLAGLDRFIPVRSDADRILTCFLEYGAETVLVHDLLQVREGDAWQLHKSCYPKLRLPAEGIGADLEAAGFRVMLNEPVGRMQAVMAQG